MSAKQVKSLRKTNRKNHRDHRSKKGQRYIFNYHGLKAFKRKRLELKSKELEKFVFY